jgi:hypothetical protein
LHFSASPLNIATDCTHTFICIKLTQVWAAFVSMLVLVLLVVYLLAAQPAPAPLDQQQAANATDGAEQDVGYT